MKKNIITILVYLSTAVSLGAGTVDYGRVLKIKSLDIKSEKLTNRIERLSRADVSDVDPVVEDRKLQVRDSLLMAAKSDLFEVQAELLEIDNR